MFRPTEDIDNVDPLAGLQYIRKIIQVSHCLLAEDGAAAGRHWNDPVPEALEASCHSVAGSRRVR